jgi:hypothetical protein
MNCRISNAQAKFRYNPGLYLDCGEVTLKDYTSVVYQVYTNFVESLKTGIYLVIGWYILFMFQMTDIYQVYPSKS